jgi:hypothetical protein
MDPETEQTEPAPDPRRPAGGPRWRTVTVALLLAVAYVLAPLTVVAIWARNTVVRTDRYVATVAPLASDPAIQGAVAEYVTNQLFQQVDVKQLAREALPEKADFLAGPLAAGLKTFTRDSAQNFLASDTFHKLWAQANRFAHSQMTALVLGEGTKSVSTSGGKVTLDLSSVIKAVQKRLKDAGIDIFDNVPVKRLGRKFVLFQSKDVVKVRSGVNLLRRVALVLPVLTLASLAGAVLLSRNRRRTVMHAGIGLAIGAGVLAAGFSVARSLYLDAIVSQRRDAAAAVFDTLLRYLRSGIRAVLVFGLLVGSGAVLAGPSRLAVRLRSLTNKGLQEVGDMAEESGLDAGPVATLVARHKPGLRSAVLVLTFVALVFWDQPTPKVVLFLALLVLVALAVIEIVGRDPRRQHSES